MFHVERPLHHSTSATERTYNRLTSRILMVILAYLWVARRTWLGTLGSNTSSLGAVTSVAASNCACFNRRNAIRPSRIRIIAALAKPPSQIQYSTAFG